MTRRFYSGLSKQERRWLKRRQAVEPAIGHLKSDHRLDRCWLKGALGDALHAISCAAGYNLRWLLRAVARLGIGPVFLRLLQTMRWAVRPTTGSHGHARHGAGAYPIMGEPDPDRVHQRDLMPALA
jgi:transposase, IS5 family